jgi:hypothetical protein
LIQQEKLVVVCHSNPVMNINMKNNASKVMMEQGVIGTLKI